MAVDFIYGTGFESGVLPPELIPGTEGTVETAAAHTGTYGLHVQSVTPNDVNFGPTFGTDPPLAPYFHDESRVNVDLRINSSSGSVAFPQNIIEWVALDSDPTVGSTTWDIFVIHNARTQVLQGISQLNVTGGRQLSFGSVAWAPSSTWHKVGVDVTHVGLDYTISLLIDDVVIGTRTQTAPNAMYFRQDFIGGPAAGLTVGSYDAYFDNFEFYGIVLEPPPVPVPPIPPFSVMHPAPEALPHQITRRDGPAYPESLKAKLRENFESIERQLLALDPEFLPEGN